MTIKWSAYRRSRRRSRQAWALLGTAAAGILAVLFWFFTSGQFGAAGAQPDGPTAVPVFDSLWMKPVQEPRPVPEGTALAALDGLAVKGRAPNTGYTREAFGQAWLDVDRNGCDTRNDILRRDLAGVVFSEGSTCKVTAGHFREPYTGRDTDFRRGQDSSRAVQIDHVVALGDAWQKGAQGLSPMERQSLANDPLNLVAADGTANQQKSAGDAATWLPKNTAIRCHYVARQISVKAAYGLWVTPAEKDAMKNVLSSCPQQQTITARPVQTAR